MNEQPELKWEVIVSPLRKGYQIELDAGSREAEETGSTVVEVVNAALLRFFNA